jgi:transposase InsO family protein
VEAEHVYESVDALAYALQAQLPSFAPWQRRDPSFKPIVSGFIWTASGPRRVTLMLDTGATHCFICAQLARALDLPASSDPGPTAVTLATPDATRSVSPPVVVHLSLGEGEPLREVLAMSPLDLGPELDIILGWDWLSSHDLRFLYPQGCVVGGGAQGSLSVPLRPAAPAPSQASVLIGHGEFRRMLRRVVPAGFQPPDEAPAGAAGLHALPPSRHGGMSKPLDPLGAAELVEADRQRQLRRARRRAGLAPPPRIPRFVDGTELLDDGTVLHLASLRLADASLALEGTDHPAFAALKAEFADVLGGPPPGLPPDRGIELVLETGDRPMPRTRPLKRLSEGELAELRRQLTDLLARGWIQHSTAGHAASVVFARKPDGTWRICYDYRGLNAITEPMVEPLPHIDALLDETRGACWFTKFDLAQGYHQVRLREADWWKTSFRTQLGQFEWKVMPFGLQGSSSVLMRVMNAVMTKGLRRTSAEGAAAGAGDPAARADGVPGATGPLHRSVVVYMDDMLCYSPSLEQHLKDVREVLSILRQEGLYVKASKCEFGRRELGFLGHRVSAAGVAVDQRKVSAVRDWPVPTSNAELRRFVGLCNYYRRFVDEYADIAAPLTRLCGPLASWQWGAEEQRSFDRLKHCLTTAPVLRTFDSRRRSVLTTDASEVALSAVLTQPDDDGHHHPVAYESRKLTAAEQAYPTHVLELLAVVHALRVFRHYLLGSGAPRPPGVRSDFTLRTDNQAVSWLRTKSDVNRFLARWLDEIEEFRFDVEHLPGRLNPADPLTRRGSPRRASPDLPADRTPPGPAMAAASPSAAPPEAVVAGAAGRCSGTGDTGPVAAFVPLGGARVQLLTGEVTAPPSPHLPERHFLAPDFIATWTEAITADPFFAPIFKGAAATIGGAVDCKGQPVSPAAARPAGGTFVIRCGLLYRRGQGEADRLCVPDGGGLRRRILHECHDTPLGGHFGRHKTTSLVRRLAYWPGQTRDVEAYVRTCEVCQHTKAEHVGPRGLLHPLPLPTRRGGVIGVDWLVGLPMTASGFDQVQVHVDHLSGKVHAVPTRSTDTAADAARIILEMALRSGDGVPDVLVVDHDPKFMSALFREFTRRIGSSLLVGSAYHKNTNARAERVNGVLGDTLRAFANGRKDDWDVWLPYAVFAINNAASTLGGGLTPFFIDRGQHPRLPLSLPDLRSAGESPSAYGVRMKALEQEVQALLHAAQQERKRALDRGRVATTFQVGDQVLLRTAELLDAAEIGKLRPRWEGPFRVSALAGPNTYTLALPRRFRCSPTVNVERLKPYYARPDKPDPPGPVTDQGQEGEYVVEQLLNRKTLRGRTYYLVRWQGHDSAEDSWEPAEHLAHCPERVAEYEAAAPRRPKALRAAAAKAPQPADPRPAGPPPVPGAPRPR